MTRPLSAWAPAGALLASLATVVAFRVTMQRENGRVSAQVASLAASMSRLQQERPAEQAAERSSLNEIAPDAAPQAHAERARQDRTAVGGSPPAASPAKASRNSLATLERRFEEEGSGQDPAGAERQQAIEVTLRETSTKFDATIHSVECRPSACRVDATFDSGKTSNAFLEYAFLRANKDGHELFAHGGVYAPVQEPAGDRHHSVFYVLTKPPGS